MWKYLAGDTFQSNDQIGLKPAEQNERKAEEMQSAITEIKNSLGEASSRKQEAEEQRSKMEVR